MLHVWRRYKNNPVSRYIFIHPGTDSRQISAYRSETTGQSLDKNQRKPFIEGGKDERIGLVHLLCQLSLRQSSGKLYGTGTALFWICQLFYLLKFLEISPSSGKSKRQPFCQIGRQKPERAKQAFYSLFFRQLSGKYQTDSAWRWGLFGICNFMLCQQRGYFFKNQTVIASSQDLTFSGLQPNSRIISWPCSLWRHQIVSRQRICERM